MKINYSFIFLIIFCLYSGFTIELGIFILSLLLHETTHLLFVLLFKGHIKKFNIFNYGLNLSIDIKDLRFLPKIIIYLSGIMMNLVIILIFKNNYFNISSSLNGLIDKIIIINKLLIVFNILVIYPLDGYQLLNTILEYIFKNDYYGNYSFKIAMICSLFTLLIFIIFSIYIESIGLCLIGLILLLKNYKKIKLRDKEVLEKIFRLIT